MASCLCTPAKAGVHHIIKPLPQNSVHDSSPRKSSVAVVPHHRSIIWVLDKTAGDDIFGKYLFGKELGRGEFGITYRCVHRETGEAFACKTISKSKLKTEIDVEDVRREAEIMRRLPKHLNIVCFKEAYEDREAVYLVMELCEGGELFDRIVAKGHYTERAAANVTRTMLEVCQVVADNLPGDQIDGIRQIFEMMDIDNNGNLTFEELRDGLVKIGHNVADPDVHMLLDAADADGNGTLSCEEFVMVSVHLKTIDSDGFLHQAFGYFDKNNSGYIEFKELREALLDDTLGPANEQVIQDIIFDVDLDKDGRISFGEFKGNDENWHGLQNGFSSIFEGIAKCTDRKLLKDESLQANYNGK